MIAAGALLLGLALQNPAADSLRAGALRWSDSALVTAARARPQVLREALTETLARAVRGTSDSARIRQVRIASRLAMAHGVAWSDSFLVLQVARFAAASEAQRAAKVWVDSVRTAGIETLGRSGARAAITVWREALALATTQDDSAGVAAVAGNVGAGFVHLEEPDSAATYLGRAITVAEAIGDRRVQANALVALAELNVAANDIVTARVRYARALDAYSRIGDTRGMAAAYNNLGLVAQDAGDLDEARQEYSRALDLNRRDNRANEVATNLVNLAALASLEGSFAESERLYRDALATWRASGRLADAADALWGLGQLEARRGRYPAARDALAEARSIRARTGPPGDAIELDIELAGILAAMGDLQAGLDQLRLAQQLADTVDAELAVRAGVMLARADLSVQLNRLAEAERLYAQAEAAYREAGDGAGAAAAQEGRGLLLVERDDPVRARQALEAALRTYRATGDERSAALTRVTLARVAVQRGDTGVAERELATITSVLDDLGDPVAAAAALGEWAALAARGGRPAVAESLYRAGLERARGREAHDVAWRLRAGLALSRRASGALDDAIRELRAALAEAERPGRTLRLPERRSGYLSDKWEFYAQLALAEQEIGRNGEAFATSERLRGREMLELLDGGRILAASDTAADLVAREQDLRRRIAELTTVLSPVGSDEPLRGPDLAGRARTTREALVRAQEAYANLRLEMRERAPAHANMLQPHIASWTDVAARLAPDEVLIEYLVGDSATLAFVIRRDRLAVLPLSADRRSIMRLIEFVRGTIEPQGRAPLDSLWRGPLRRLHSVLITPAEDRGLLRGVRRLVLVPHAELQYLPFAALLDESPAGRFLVERYELVMVPSASVWLALGERPRASAQGTLAMAPRPDALPASRQEVAAIARLRDGSRVLTGGAATEGAFRREAARFGVLHLATFGTLNRQNPLFSFVELARDETHDGRLEVHEVFGLALNADLVVLSACQTAVGSGVLADVPAGDDWVGLTRAFLHAGAASVLATLWPVADRPTADLMERFYERFDGQDAAGALAVAQRSMLANPSTAHPFHWAGFVLTGGDRSRR
ncbi:MAG TPA: CHAT domain-containing tetratricopeptide repeat protein [Gemmatimonadaceae bacterium]